MLALLALLACHSPAGDTAAGETGSGGGDTGAPFELEASCHASSPTDVDVDYRFSDQAEHELCAEVGRFSRCWDAPGRGTLYLYGLQPGGEHAVELRADGWLAAELRCSTPQPAGHYSLLFDRDHGEQAGNADWVIDDDYPSPSPSSPSSETAWRGAYSSFGYELWRTGRYELRSTDGRLDASALAGVDALVVPEPNNPFSDGELEALADFVRAGGGLLLVADHKGADRDGDGWSAVDVCRVVLDALEAPLELDDVNVSEEQARNLSWEELDPVVHGPFGDVAEMGFYAATTAQLLSETAAEGLVWRGSIDHGTRDLLAARARVGEGRIVLVTDSAPADDGTGASGDELYDSWHEQDNAAFFLNAAAWLAGDPG